MLVSKYLGHDHDLPGGKGGCIRGRRCIPHPGHHEFDIHRFVAIADVWTRYSILAPRTHAQPQPLFLPSQSVRSHRSITQAHRVRTPRRAESNGLSPRTTTTV